MLPTLSPPPRSDPSSPASPIPRRTRKRRVSHCSVASLSLQRRVSLCSVVSLTAASRLSLQRRVSHCRPSLTTPCEFLNGESFHGMKKSIGKVQSIMKEELAFFLPLYIHPLHGEQIQDAVEETMKVR